MYLNIQYLNNINNLEYSLIIASLKYVFEKKFQCNIEEKYIKNNRLMIQQDIDRIRAFNGCFSKLTSPQLFHKYKKVIFKRCVCNFYDYKINSLLEMNEYYNKNMQLYIYNNKDTVYSKTMQAIKIVNNFIEEKRQEEYKKQQDEYKKGLK